MVIFALDPDSENIDPKYPDPISGGKYTPGHPPQETQTYNIISTDEENNDENQNKSSAQW